MPLLDYAETFTEAPTYDRFPASANGVDDAQTLSPMKALTLFSTSAERRYRPPDNRRREIRLRRITEPTAEQKSLLHQLGLSLPERLKSLSNVVQTLRSPDLILKGLPGFPTVP